MGSPTYRERFFLYPEPIRAPDGPPRVERNANPRIRGILLVASAFLLELFYFIRRMSWANTGFDGIRKIRKYIEDTEPRFDPTVFPLPYADAKSKAADEAQLIDVANGYLEESSPVPTARRRYSVADYRSLYLSGELTPTDVAKAILPLIRRDTSPPGQHSIAWFDVKVDLVLKAAAESTTRYKEKRSLGPLDGVPTAVKDEYDLEGYITTLGSVNDYTGQQMLGDTIDSWCVRKLLDTGAVIFGKLSMHEFGLDTSGCNILYGTPRNPYNNEYYTGGSSSGSAYAVATGIIPIALGSDGGGSIRIPSSFCSVVGLKPTHGRLSCFPGQNHSNTCGVNGPIAADVHSLAAMYSIISEPHPSSHFPPLSTSSNNKLVNDARRPKLIGIPEAWFQRATPAIQKLCRDLVDWMVAHKGYTVVNIDIPFVAEGQIAHAMTVLTDAATLLPVTKGLSPANRVMIALGTVTPATDFLLGQKLRRVLMQHLAWLWQTYPGMVIVTPTTSCAGWPIRSKSELKYGLTDGDQTLKTMEYVWMGNFCGVPSLSVPAGYIVPDGSPSAGDIAGIDSPGRVPVGLMATGEWASEHALLQFGLDAEEAGASKQSRPPTWVDIIELAKRGAQNGSA